MSEYVDFLIVGGGISGLSLQLRLQELGFRTALINNGQRNVSTRIAAGIVNPVAGKFFALTWRADDFFPELGTHYQELERKFDAQFYYPKPIYRMLSSAGEQNRWLSKAHLPKYEGYCSFEQKEIEHAQADFGLLKIECGGHLDTNVFLDQAIKYLGSKALLRDEIFKHQELDVKSKQYQDVKFDKIIFCEGYDVVNNPFFNYLPFTPNKGEVLEIETEELDPEKILVGGVFVLPIGENRYKVGASYDHFDLSLEKTEKSRSYLVERFEKMLSIDYKITQHLVGLRPAVSDRRPLLGQHPEYDSLYIFNGLGSKGVSMSPVLSAEMSDLLVNNANLHPDCNISRF